MSITLQTPLPLSGEQCRKLVDSLVEGVMIADESQNITFVNPALARILGVSAADILGHQPAEFMDDAARVSMLGEIEPGNADHAHTYEQAKFREDGTPLPARVSLWPTFDRGRRLSGCVRIVSDLSELKCMQAVRDQRPVWGGRLGALRPVSRTISAVV